MFLFSSFIINDPTVIPCFNKKQPIIKMKVVLVGTSSSKLQAHDTGLWLEEMAAPYYEFESAGHEVIIASPAGGAIPIDSASMGEMFFTEPSKKFMHDATAIGKLCHSVKISDLDLDSVDCIFLTGGHGVCTDYINQPSLKSAIETLYKSGKVVAAVCHGVVGLTDCVKEDGIPLISGLNITGFSNTEEEAVQLTSLVPFSVEDKLGELGGKYTKADDWNSKVCVDGKLLTGQNPQSSEALAKAVLEILV